MHSTLQKKLQRKLFEPPFSPVINNGWSLILVHSLLSQSPILAQLLSPSIPYNTFFWLPKKKPVYCKPANDSVRENIAILA